MSRWGAQGDLTSDPRFRLLAATVLPAGFGLALVALGQSGFTDAHPSRVWFGVWAVGLSSCVAAVSVATRDHEPVLNRDPSPRTGWVSARTLVPAGVAVGTWFVAWWVQRSRPAEANRWDLVPVWALGVGCAIGAVWQPPPRSFAEVVRAWWRRRGRDVLVSAALLGVGGALTFIRLGSFPLPFNGDEGGYALTSRSVVEGAVSNPFAVGYLGHPMFGHVIQSAMIWWFGPSVAAARALSAAFGAMSVPLAYVAGALLTASRRAGLCAAGLLATFPPHLYWSRSALPNGASTFFVLALVILVHRATRNGRAAAFVATGLIVGFAQYFYFSTQVLIPVVVLVLVVAAVERARTGCGWSRSARGFVRQTALVVFGIASMAAPMIGFYLANPGQFGSRLRQVSLLDGSNLDDTARLRGVSGTRVIWDNAVSAAMLPFRSRPQGFFRGDVPFVGWPIALLGAIGLAIAVRRTNRPGWSCLVAMLATTVVGLAITTGPTDTNRWVNAIPLMCVGAAIGLHSLAAVFAAAWPKSGRAVSVVVLVLTALTATWNLYEATRTEPPVFAIADDANTRVAERAALEILAIDPHAVVYFCGAPRMGFNGFGNLMYRTTPGVRGIDLPDSLSAEAPRVQTADGRTTIFVVLPHRYDDLRTVSAWFPSGREQVVGDDDGEMFRMWIVTP